MAQNRIALLRQAAPREQRDDRGKLKRDLSEIRVTGCAYDDDVRQARLFRQLPQDLIQGMRPPSRGVETVLGDDEMVGAMSRRAFTAAAQLTITPERWGD